MPQGRARRRRRLPIGAEPVAGRGAHFRVWAPLAREVHVALEAGPTIALASEGDGYFAGTVREARPGSLYRYRLDGGEHPYPDPASRFQPDGPHGPSQVVDPTAFRWTDPGWRGLRPAGQVFYEMHVGTFTPEGTFAAAAGELEELAALGITAVELMPVAEFSGRFGWGYDGVNLFAPTHLYGSPDDLRRLVDRAHAVGLGVILDVVYNHFGPDGNYLGEFSADYTTNRYTTDWGKAVNFDDERAGPVREFVIANAGYWIDEFHIDGLRLDATQNLYDRSPEHILAALARRVRAAGGRRHTLLVAENETQDTRLVRAPEARGYGLDALWNDDFHHAARVAATGRAEGYYVDYRGTPQELVSVTKRSFLYQGQRYVYHDRRRGTPALDLPPEAFVTFLENHDQLANSAGGERLCRVTSPGRHRALTALLLLGPGTPLLFQGQEFSASAPFVYFADYGAELGRRVRRGRLAALAVFPSLATPEMQERIPDPTDPRTFALCKLDLSERVRHQAAYALHRDLLRLRREDAVLRAPRRGGVDGAVLGEHAFILRFFGPDHDDRVLVVNLGCDLPLEPAPEPLLAPPAGATWALIWSSDDLRYGGAGVIPRAPDEGRGLPAESAALFGPARVRSPRGCSADRSRGPTETRKRRPRAPAGSGLRLPRAAGR